MPSLLTGPDTAMHNLTSTSEGETDEILGRSHGQHLPGHASASVSSCDHIITRSKEIPQTSQGIVKYFAEDATTCVRPPYNNSPITPRERVPCPSRCQPATIGIDGSGTPNDPHNLPNRVRRRRSNPTVEAYTSLSAKQSNFQCWEHECNGRKFSNQSNLNRHRREFSKNVNRYRCFKCLYSFSRRAARDQHVNRKVCTKMKDCGARSRTADSFCDRESGGSDTVTSYLYF